MTHSYDQYNTMYVNIPQTQLQEECTKFNFNNKIKNETTNVVCKDMIQNK